MLKWVHVTAAVAFAAGVSGTSFAQQPAAPTPASSGAQTDSNANQIICRKQEVTGSRLGAKKVCKTRAEWADSQLQTRQEVERVQTQRGLRGD